MVVRTDRPIVISLVRGAKRDATLAFVREFMFARNHSAPPPPPQLLFAAWQGNEIAGTISLDFAEEGSLPFEQIREFATPLSLAPYPRERAAQYGRWAARIPHISAALGYAATLHALKHGKVHGFCEAKPSVISRLRSLGIEAAVVPNEGVDLAQVPPEGRPYYASSPAPDLFLMDLWQVKEVLGRLSRHYLERRGILLEPDLL